jgi:hypothetical protein
VTRFVDFYPRAWKEEIAEMNTQQMNKNQGKTSAITCMSGLALYGKCKFLGCFLKFDFIIF